MRREELLFSQLGVDFFLNVRTVVQCRCAIVPSESSPSVHRQAAEHRVARWFAHAGLQLGFATGDHAGLILHRAGADTIAGRASGGLAIPLVSINRAQLFMSGCRSCMIRTH